jgi:hypothetical protein
MRHIKQFPHCDQRVLHAPEDNCEFCNMHPEWQELRKAWGIAFTGHSYDKHGDPLPDGNGGVILPCPAQYNRGMTSVDGWHGNVAFTPDVKKAFDEGMDRLKASLKERFNLSDDDL